MQVIHSRSLNRRLSANYVNGTMEVTVEQAQCSTQIYNFSERLLQQLVHFHALKLTDSVFLWIGTGTANLSSLAVAMTTKFDNIPASASLLGETSDTPSMSLAQKLAKKTGKQIFVSYNLQTDPMLLPLVEKRLIEEIDRYPDKF
ncbi:proteasome assembly chaperone 4-like [Ptychodera flava]|uniref:proteasome assembly chaperone 4-like n=1 Tax=Ptychodera flava TaxID=63121 RepID=UPI00396A5F78